MNDYYKRKELSNSALGYLKTGVKYFKEKMKGMDDENIYSIFGNVIHTFILEEKEFFKRYVIEPSVKPISSNQKKYCNLRASGKSKNTAIELSYKKATDSMADELEETLSIYIEFLKNSNGRRAISQSMYNAATIIRQNIKQHKLANPLMYDNIFLNKTETYNEKEFIFSIDDIPFKGKVDRLKIDYDNKIVTIIDLKTYTLRYNYIDRKSFIFNKIKQRDIDRQLAVYKKAIKFELLKEFDDLTVSDFEFKYYIVFASTDVYNYIDVVEIPSKMIEKEGEQKINEGIADYQSYLKHEESDHDRYYHENNGVLLYTE